MEIVDSGQTADTAGTLIEMTGGRGPESVIDAVGMEAHDHDEPAASKVTEVAQCTTGLLPDRAAQKIADVAAVDRLDALHVAVKAVRPGRHRLGQGRVRRRDRSHADDGDDRPRGTAAHGSGPSSGGSMTSCPWSAMAAIRSACSASAPTTCPWTRPPHEYEIFRNKADGCLKVVLQP